ncbi:MAG TPA: cytochrome P450, partial [Jatrophihabitantaceae bacterium]|nr:cytochrome P450 [Jatrophihabitantaceae bacterium]
MAEFDHHSTDFAANWREIYGWLREHDPVARTDAHGGYVVVTRYDDVKRVLLDPATFVSGREVLVPGRAEPIATGVTIPRNPFRMGMMEMDAPDNTAFRKILVPWFSGRAIAAAEEHIRDIVNWCLDRVIESGRMDLVDDLANPVPALVTLDLLGLPLTNWHRYGVVLHEAAYRAKGSAKEIAWLQADVARTLEERRAHPPEIATPVDALLAAEVDGAPLPADLVVEMVLMLLTGGIDTSTGLIAHGLRHLSAHPTLRDRLAADPSLIPAAVDELLRYFSPGTTVARTAVADTDIGGVPVHAGERVFLGIGAANGDEREFTRPEIVDIDREDNRHVAFGMGVHRCLGAFLAKTEMTIVLAEVLRRLPDL